MAVAESLTVKLQIVDELSSKLADAASAGDRVAASLKGAGDEADEAVRKLTSGADEAEKSMKAAADATADLAGDVSHFSDALDEQAKASEDAARGVDDLGEQADEAAREITPLGEEARKAGESAKDLGEESERGAKGVGSLSESVDALRSVLSAAGIAMTIGGITAALGDFVHAAGDFGSSLAKVSTIADTSAKSMVDIRSEISQLSRDTGVAVSDLSESVYSAISASVDTASAVEFTARANELAVGGFTTAATAVDVLTTAINAYGMEVSDASAIADRLIMTQNLGKTSVDELAQTMGRVIPVASAFGVDLDNLSASYAVLTANGIQTAYATTYVNSMMAELADTGSKVSKELGELTGSTFTQLMEQGMSLGDVLQILGAAAGGDAVAFANMWGSMEAGKGAVAILNAGAEQFNSTLGKMRNSTGAAAEAFETMAGTSEYAFQRMANSSENLRIALGEALEPMAVTAAKAVTTLTDSFSRFAERNAPLVQVITSMGIAVTVVTAGVTAYTTATKLATMAQEAFNLTLGFTPWGVIAAAVGVLTVGIIGLAAAASDAGEAEERLTARSQALSDEIDRQEGRVAFLSRRYGEHSDEAIEARATLEDLREEFERSGETVGRMTARINENIEASRKTRTAYADAASGIEAQSTAALVMVEQLERLSATSGKTIEAREAERAITSRLVKEYPELAQEYDSVTGRLNKSAEALRKYVEQKGEEAKAQARANTYFDNLEHQVLLEEDRLRLTEQIRATEEELADVVEERGGRTLDVYDANRAAIAEMMAEEKRLNEELESQRVQLSEVESEYDNVTRAVERYEESMGGAAEAAREMADQNVASVAEAQAAADEWVAQMDADMAAVGESFASAVESARSAADSVNATYDELVVKAQGSAQELSGIWQNHAQYWTQYAEDIKKAKEAGFSTEVISQFANGTQESAGKLHALVEEYENIGEGAKGAGESAAEAKEKQDEFAESVNADYESMQEAMDEWAVAVGDVTSGYSEKIEEMKSKTEDFLESLDGSAEAKKAAEATMNSYIRQLEAGISEAVRKARAGAQSIASALKAATAVKGNASGTTYGESVYIAGENGPELIIGREGSEVFPASETARILSAVMQTRREERETEPMPKAETIREVRVESGAAQGKRGAQDISITLNGKGRLDIGQSVSRSDLVNYIQDEVEGVILSILSRQIYEEGAMVYEF